MYDRALDATCNWLAAHPRLTCLAIVALCLIPQLDVMQ